MSLGICLKNASGNVVIDEIDRASPNSSLVRAGDVVIAVNDVSVRGRPLSDVKPLLKGPAGMKLRLAVLRPGGTEILTLVRSEPTAVRSHHSIRPTQYIAHEPYQPITASVAGPSVRYDDASTGYTLAQKAPLHKLIVWDGKAGGQVMIAGPRDQQPLGFLDVTVLDVENLPPCYDVGWSLASLGTGTASPYVECSVGGCKLRTGAQSSKLSCAINQTLRLAIIDPNPLVLRIKNEDISLDGAVIGEIVFPMDQICGCNSTYEGRFRMLVARDHSQRVPTLKYLPHNAEVTGLRGQPSTVHIALNYVGPSYTELVESAKVEEARRMREEQAKHECKALREERERLLEAKRLAELQEKKLLKDKQAQDIKLFKEEQEREQRVAKAREEAYARSKASLSKEREAFAEIRRKRTQEIAVACNEAVERRMLLRESTLSPQFDFDLVMLADAAASLRAIAAAGYEIVLVTVAHPPLAQKALYFLQASGVLGVASEKAVASHDPPIKAGNVLFCLDPAEKAVIMRQMGGFVAAIDSRWQTCESLLAIDPREQLHAICFSPNTANEKEFSDSLAVKESRELALHELLQEYGTRHAAQVMTATARGEEVPPLPLPSHGRTVETDNFEGLQRLAPLIVDLDKKLSGRRSIASSERPWLQACDLLHVPRALVEELQPDPPPAGAQSAVRVMYPLAASDDATTIDSLRAGKIPDGWEEIVDEVTGDSFFVNHCTKTSSWLPPVHAAEDVEAAAWMQRARRVASRALPDVGIGITLSKDASGKMRVVALQDAGAAQTSGRIRVDDVVMSVNGVPVADQSALEVMQSLVGPPGTPVVLQLEKMGANSKDENQVTWADLVSKATPAPDNPSCLVLGNMRLSFPMEDDAGIFTVSEFADPTKIVYRGHGSYTGLWEVLCAESRQVPGRPEVFMWGENELLQPSYDVRGICTVRKAHTQESYSPDDLIYRGPGDSYVRGHPGNSANHMPFVWIERAQARPKRGRVMVDLARCVLRVAEEEAPPPPPPAPARPPLRPERDRNIVVFDNVVAAYPTLDYLARGDEAAIAAEEERKKTPVVTGFQKSVGCAIVFDGKYEVEKQREELLKRQLLLDLATSLNVGTERFSTPTLEPDRRVAKLNILPSAFVGDASDPLAKPPPSSAALLKNLIYQAQYPAYPLKQQPLTSCVAGVHALQLPAPMAGAPQADASTLDLAAMRERGAVIRVCVRSAQALPLVKLKNPPARHELLPSELREKAKFPLKTDVFLVELVGNKHLNGRRAVVEKEVPEKNCWSVKLMAEVKDKEDNKKKDKKKKAELEETIYIKALNMQAARLPNVVVEVKVGEERKYSPLVAKTNSPNFAEWEAYFPVDPTTDLAKVLEIQVLDMEQALLGSMLGRSQFPVSVIRDNWLKDLRIDRSFIRQPGPGGQEIEVGELLMSVEYLASQSECEQHGKTWYTYSSPASMPSALSVVPAPPSTIQQQQQPFSPPSQSVTPQATVEQKDRTIKLTVWALRSFPRTQKGLPTPFVEMRLGDTVVSSKRQTVVVEMPDMEMVKEGFKFGRRTFETAVGFVGIKKDKTIRYLQSYTPEEYDAIKKDSSIRYLGVISNLDEYDGSPDGNALLGRNVPGSAAIPYRRIIPYNITVDIPSKVLMTKDRTGHKFQENMRKKEMSSAPDIFEGRVATTVMPPIPPQEIPLKAVNDKGTPALSSWPADSGPGEESVAFVDQLQINGQGRLHVVLCDSTSGCDLGKIVFPVHKLAEVREVEGWYNFKHPDGDSEEFVRGWNPFTQTNDGGALAIKMKIRIED